MTTAVSSSEGLAADLAARRLAVVERKGTVIDLSMVNPDEPPPRLLLDRLGEASVKQANHRYTVSRGVTRCREAFAAKYRERFGVAADPESEVCVTFGTKDAVTQVLAAVASPGDVVLTHAPAYPGFLFAAGLARLAVATFPHDPDPDRAARAAADAVRGTRPRVVLLGYPANPGGAAAPEGLFEAVTAAAKEVGAVVLNDFVYGELGHGAVHPRSLLSARGPDDPVVETYSLSKAYGVPGWRVGAVTGNRSIVAEVARRKSLVDYGLFLPLQLAAAAALTVDEPLADEAAARYARRAAALGSALARDGWKVESPAAGASLWAELPGRYDRGPDSSYAFTCELLEAGVAVTPGRAFFPGGAGGGRHVRFALVAPEERLREAARLAAGVTGGAAA